jgi:hypothetical protein
VDGFVLAIGQGITGFIRGAFTIIGETLRGVVDAADRALPGGILFVVVFVVLVLAAWNFAKR